MKGVFLCCMTILFQSLLPVSAQVQKEIIRKDKKLNDRSISLVRIDKSANSTWVRKTYQYYYDERYYTLDFRGSNIIAIMKDNQAALSEMQKFRWKRTFSRIGAIVMPLGFIWSVYGVTSNFKPDAGALGAAVLSFLTYEFFYNSSSTHLINAVNIYNTSIAQNQLYSPRLRLIPVFGMVRTSTSLCPALSLYLQF